MAKGFTIKATGLKELKKKFGKIPENVANEVDAVLAYGANDFVNRAVNDAPVDEGYLRLNITQERKGEMNYEVVSAAPYSAFVEFGTITRVVVPTDLVDYAKQFKGKGLRKTGGMAARPFFFKQREPVQQAVNKKLQPAIKKALDK